MHPKPHGVLSMKRSKPFCGIWEIRCPLQFTRQHATGPLPYYWFGVGNYMVFYVVDGNAMEVRRFLYGARDLTRMIP